MTARSLQRRLARLEQRNPVELRSCAVILNTWSQPPPSEEQVAAELKRVHPGGCGPYPVRPGGAVPFHCLVWMRWDGHDAPPRFARDWEFSGYWGTNQREQYEADHRTEARP